VNNVAAVNRAALMSIWTDDPAEYPRADQAIWWEAWIRRSGADATEAFRAAARAHGLRTGALEFAFVDRVVLTAFGTQAQMAAVFGDSDALAELRAAKALAAEFLALAPREQAEWARALADRVTAPAPESPAVCVLDTGVNRQHVLLQPGIAPADVLACDPRWGTHDHQGHGTEMAGLGLYGDLGPVLLANTPVLLQHCVESVKILPPAGENDREVHGAITREAVARAEVNAPERTRTLCLTVTTKTGRDRGRPSSWSAALDEISSGALDGDRRLFCVAGGNTDRAGFANYPDSNVADAIHDPGQSWNALTVGAMADRVQLVERDFAGWQPIAKLNDLAPCSTTSSTWQRQRPWAIKPEIVMPGGNAAISPDRRQTDCTDSLSLLTTNWMPLARQFAATGDTSAATALASRLAARIQARYPRMWPETLRALIVHSADWTDEMLRRFPGRAAPLERLRWFGFGMPVESAALNSADDALTLITQQEIQPFDRRRDRNGKVSYVTRDMHLYALPWPADVLAQLGATEVELRVTLSYFVEPSPGERGWRYRHRYASHGLRFDVKTATEDVQQFRTRINRAAREEDEEATSRADHTGWVVGPETRAAGSIHSDRWYGLASDLAARGVIAVYPTIGWWRERHRLEKWARRTRYALIVSIRTPTVETDIYTPVAAQIGVPVETIIE
jgi:hypothetical protein